MDKYIFGDFEFLYVYDCRLPGMIYESVYLIQNYTDTFSIGLYNFNRGTSIYTDPLLVDVL